MSFRIKKLPKDEKSMEEIVREIQEKEREEHEHEHHHEHQHNYYHEHEETHAHSVSSLEAILDAIAHVMEHQLGELAQISERSSRMSRSLDELVSSLEDLRDLTRILIKLQLAQLIEDKDLRKKLIADALEKL